MLQKVVVTALMAISAPVDATQWSYSIVEMSVSITNERSVPLTSKLSSELTSFTDVANMFF